MQAPRHALEAPSHADPYSWYAELRRTRPLAFDPAIGLWVAADPAIVRAALAHPALRIRPPGEDVPRALQGRPTGEVFAQLVRMNDGAFHAQHRPDVEASTRRFDAARVAEAAVAATRDLAGRLRPDDLLWAIPVQAMARLLGVGEGTLDATVGWVWDFVQGMGAGASEETLARSDAAVLALMEQGEREGLTRVLGANRIALMQQALDATAGLIGNAARELQLRPASLEGTAFVEAVAKSDPAVHNTRRFAAQDLQLAGQRMEAGQGVMLLLVAQGLGFGAGAHACPGERIAVQLAAAALRTLQSQGVLGGFQKVSGYRPLPNARVPVFASRLSSRP